MVRDGRFSFPGWERRRLGELPTGPKHSPPDPFWQSAVPRSEVTLLLRTVPPIVPAPVAIGDRSGNQLLDAEIIQCSHPNRHESAAQFLQIPVAMGLGSASGTESVGNLEHPGLSGIGGQGIRPRQQLKIRRLQPAHIPVPLFPAEGAIVCWCRNGCPGGPGTARRRNGSCHDTKILLSLADPRFQDWGCHLPAGISVCANQEAASTTRSATACRTMRSSRARFL